MVVFVPPVGDLPARIPQVPEPTGIETFIAKASVKALDVAVLRGLARLDVDRGNASFDAPSQIVPTADLRPVIGF